MSTRDPANVSYRLQQLERDVPLVLDVLPEVDRGHAALTELTLDAVATSERGVEAINL